MLPCWRFENVCLSVYQSHICGIVSRRSMLVEVSLKGEMVLERPIPGIDAVITEEMMLRAG